MNRSPSHNTAVLLFANSSNEEIQLKKMAKGKPLFDALTEHTLKTIEKTGLPFFHISEENQTGNSFGERFANAIQFVFDKGYENIITVGNDSPHLTKEHLIKTHSKLQQGESVIGPSADGGFYLMGMHFSSFEKSFFEELSWQTSGIKEEIVDLLSISGLEIHLLPALFDIDTFWDVQCIANYTFGLTQDVRNAICNIVSIGNHKIEIPSFPFISGFHIQIPFNKGSPLPCFS